MTKYQPMQFGKYRIETDPCPDYGFTEPFFCITEPAGFWEYEHTGIGNIRICSTRVATLQEAIQFCEYNYIETKK